MKKTMLICLLLPVLMAASCCKEKDCKTELTGVLRDLNGKLDGCQWMVELDNGRKLEIRSLPAGTVLTDGKKVTVVFTINRNSVSNCMAGEIADISSLRYL